MSSAIVNLGQIQRQVSTPAESQCTAFKRKLTQFTEDLLPPFLISRYAKLFMGALECFDEAVRKKREKGHRVYLGESTVSFLLHEPSQSIQSTIKNIRKNSSESTTPDVSDTEEENALYALRSLPGFVDGFSARDLSKYSVIGV